MSYLDNLRMNFSGTFFADPSTINNLVSNFNPENWDPINTELFWNPMGTSNFKFKDCNIKSIKDGELTLSNDGEKDTIIGQSILVEERRTLGKIVDLDPQQQGCSALFGVKLLIGSLDGAYVAGNFEAAAFRQLWNRLSEGMAGSSGMGAIYQSTLTNLVWNEKDSKFLAELKKESPDRLSIKFTLDLYNSSPLSYIINDGTMVLMKAAGVPVEVINKLIPLRTASISSQTISSNKIPTEIYFDHLLRQQLDDNEMKLYGDIIMEATQVPYKSSTTFDSVDMEFTQGRITGSIGPSNDNDPLRSNWGRMLNPTGAYQGINTGPLGFTPFQVNENQVILDLSNTLPNKINEKGQVSGEIDLSKLNNSLDFGYYENKDTSNFTLIKTFTLDELNNDLLMNNGGILNIELTDEEAKKIKNTPCLIRYSNEEGIQIPLKEQEDGLFLSADEVFFRMNPGFKDDPRAGEQELKIYVSQFGEKKEGIKVYAQSMSSEDTNKIFKENPSDPNTGTPAEALQVSTKTDTTDTDHVYTQSDKDGVASFTLSSNDPNNPRGFIDGQLYYISIASSIDDLTVSNALFGQNMNGVSALVFNDTPMVDKPTWDRDIGPILSQYGQLYPVMKQFDLGNFEVVKNYSQTILNVMKLSIDDPMHMPVTRDFSLSRLALLEQWINTGMAKS